MSSKPDKEAIYEQFREALNINDMSGHGKNPFILKCIEICEYFSASQNSELKKENEELREKIKKWKEEIDSNIPRLDKLNILITKLQSTIEEKDKEIDKLNRTITLMERRHVDPETY